MIENDDILTDDNNKDLEIDPLLSERVLAEDYNNLLRALAT